jgi:2,3-dihydroxyphenylpropionate 1,2-dioxygenase
VSEIIGLVGISHSPFATMLPPADSSEPGGRFMADAARVAAAVARLEPDAVVVIGPDHFHANFYDVMPPFVLGVEEAEGFGDFGSRSGPLPVAAGLAWPIRDGLAGAGFDVALSYALTVDHGVVQSYDVVCGGGAGAGRGGGAGARGGTAFAGAGLPLVPLVVNTAAPPLPSMERCAALGRALGAAIREADFGGRVLLIASGGLSHWLPSNDPRDSSVVAERRASVIHGRRDVRAVAAAREPAVRAMGGNPNAHVNTEWDGWFLKQLADGDLSPIAELGDAGLEESAGRGGHEIRTWLVGLAAVDAPLAWTSYEAVPEWITGMGIGTTFEVS